MAATCFSDPIERLGNRMSISITHTDIHILNMRTRMPFKYGIATLTALPHAFVRVEIDLDGERGIGIAADGLPPKWFTKNPEQTFRDELEDMLDVIRTACALATDAPPSLTPYALWRHVYGEQAGWGAASRYPALLWGFGVSLVERALIDAYCRVRGTTFARAVRGNELGIILAEHYPDLAAYEPADLLPAEPIRRTTVRHTVGLGDPVTDAWLAEDECLDDGLPQSLAACIQTYGLTHLKIKLSGHPEGDLERLRLIAGTAHGGALDDFAFTLDGNEQYGDVESFQSFWLAASADPALTSFLRHLLFVEQPFHRDVALEGQLTLDLRAWAGRPPMIIDESDGHLTDLATALDSGYVGTSHKNCKGVFKGIANACLIEHRRRQDPRGSYVISAEDLANVGPVALLQDLAVIATLGIEHTERNGHHYFLGLSMLPADMQEAVLSSHGDLYRRHEGGFPSLDVTGGQIDIGSVVDAPFGFSSAMDPSRFVPLEEWSPDQLGAI